MYMCIRLECRIPFELSCSVLTAGGDGCPEQGRGGEDSARASANTAGIVHFPHCRYAATCKFAHAHVHTM